MGQKVILGGERLGSGNNQEVWMDGYHSSNHDLSFVWRSSMPVGALVPFCKIPVLPGDNFDINVKSLIKTKPTSGPVMGGFKYQIDFFMCPNRLYIGPLHNNATGVGRKMEKVLLPTITYKVPAITEKGQDLNLEQVAPDSLTYYLGISGLGYNPTGKTQERQYNGLPFLAVADIFKNYYANKQEENAYVISNVIPEDSEIVPESIKLYTPNNTPVTANQAFELTNVNKEIFKSHHYQTQETINNLNSISFPFRTTSNPISLKFQKIPQTVDMQLSRADGTIVNAKFSISYIQDPDDRDNDGDISIKGYLVNTSTAIQANLIGSAMLAEYKYGTPSKNGEISIQSFPLENIDKARDIILAKRIGQKLKIGQGQGFDINFQPYVQNCAWVETLENNKIKLINATSNRFNGLFLRTYMSDMYNNWLRTEWIDEINAASAIQIKDGQFTMDALIIAKRVWDYQNRVAVSGGTYQDWQEATWGRDAQRFCESPIFIGGASGTISFDEVVSNSATEGEPLGTLAGKGGLGSYKGGKINIKASEIGYVIGIVSIVPYVDYYQGTDWDMTELISMLDYHKPEFDRIGFQDLSMERMASWTTKIKEDGTLEKKALGKQPAWTHYMSNVNKVCGDFCRPSDDYEVITRKYQRENDTITDATTYVFPQHYNYPFAIEAIDMAPFWVQIGCDVFARRIMSAAAMPSL